MAYKAQIKPQSGSSSELITLQLELDSNIETRVIVENATHGSIIDEFTLSPGEIKVTRQFDLKIPEHSSDSMISIFVNIEVKQQDKFNLVQILPLIYSVNEDALTQSGSSFEVSPSFVSQDGDCKISVAGKTNDKYIVSINDKRFNVIVNPSGFGSIHFKSRDVLTDDSSSVSHKFPIYYYTASDNYVSKYFSGSYLNIVPNDIKAAVDVDPRCETYDPLTWEPPLECDDDPDCELGDPPPCPPIPCIPGVDPDCTGITEPEIPGNCLPKKECNYDDCSTCDCESVTDDIVTDTCRIHKLSSALISNGMVLTSYVSVDDSIITPTEDNYNKQRVFVKSSQTSLDAQIVASQNVAVLPKEADEDFTVYITKELYDLMIALDEAGKFIMAAFLDEKMNYECFPVKDIFEADEYTPFYTLIVDREDSNIKLSQLDACVYTVFYEFDENGVVEPSIELPDNVKKLPFIDTIGGEEVLSATNVSVSSNDSYRGSGGESFVHIVAEAYSSGQINLFYYGFSVGPSGYNSTGSDSWVQLTTDGSNKNAQTVTDKYNNLHIFWESDRTGLDQIYYGIIGPSAVFYTNAVLSSVIDKKAELDNKEEKPFGYLSQNIIEPTGEILERISEQGEIDEYTGAITYPNKGILNTAWINNVTNDGVVSVTEVDDVSDITIESSTLSDTAVAFTKLDKDNFFDLSSGVLSQMNYQVSFGFSGEISQDISGSALLSQEDIDELYDIFKSQFEETVDSNVVNNLPFHVSDSNRFNVGLENEVYDRFIPIMGSYKNTELENHTEGDTIADNFTIYASGGNRNLNHFFVAVVPEKVRFKATNIEDKADFTERVGNTVDYNEEEVQEYYTGRAALAVIYTQNSNLFSFELANVNVRNISKPFVLSEVTNIDILVNYSKMFNEDVARYLGIAPSISEGFPRFVCNLSIMINGDAKFSESFLVDMSDKYRSFDIGLGVTSQGSFKADNFYPYNSSVFEEASVIFNYSDVTISSPTYRFNADVVSTPSYTREQLDLSTHDFYGNEEDVAEEFFNNYDFLFEATDPSFGGYVPDTVPNPSSGIIPDSFNIVTQNPFSLDEFMQIPLTLEGVNSNASVTLDYVNNINLTWQSNRDKNWNIFHSCSTNKNMPFRFDTQITDTDSNSLSPDIASDNDGRRMIVWHDDRNGDFEIFSARALESLSSANEDCENNGILQFITDDVAKFVIFEFDFIASCPGNAHFIIQFYGDSGLTQLVETVSSKQDQDGWTVNGVPLTLDGISVSDEVRIAFTPNPKTSIICGKLVYGKVTPIYI